MEANQFRKGNIVQFEKPVHVQLGDIIDLTERTISLSSYGIHLIDCDEKTIVNPIPITEEWLKKLGFMNLWGFDWVIGELHPTIHKRDMYVYRNKEGFFYEDFRRKIQYVHQLQNLYFALTGEELQLKN